MPGRSDRILTSHVGSLPRPEHLIALNAQRASGEFTDEAGYQEELKTAVIDLVRRQKETGIDLVNDGEYGHSMGHDYDSVPGGPTSSSAWVASNWWRWHCGMCAR